MHFDGIDHMLLFSLRSVTIFNSVADALIWHLRRTAVPHIEHYLDDYFITGLPNSKQCQESLEVLDRECHMLGVPTAAHKWEGPIICLGILGIDIDSVEGQLRLPAEKLSHPTAGMEEPQVLLPQRA